MDAKQTWQRLEALGAEIKRNEREAEVEPVDSRGGELCLSVRYFGGGWGWEVPEDEEDDGDYDWKRPTAATRAKLDALVAARREQIPGLAWRNDGEKCWVTFFVKVTN